jgi:hypothetical protein
MSTVRQTNRARHAQTSEMVAMLTRIARREPEYGDHYDLEELVAALLNGEDANVLLGLQEPRVGSPTDSVEEKQRVKAMFRMAVLIRAGESPGRAAKKVAQELKNGVSDKTILNHWKGKGKKLKHGDFLVPYTRGDGKTVQVTRWRERGEKYADAREDFLASPLA